MALEAADRPILADRRLPLRRPPSTTATRGQSSYGPPGSTLARLWLLALLPHPNDSLLALADARAKLTGLDAERAEIFDVTEVDANSDFPAAGQTVSPVDARESATVVVGDTALGGRVYSGLAAQHFGEGRREVLVVVIDGGTMPFGGPVGEELTDRAARVTGLIIDAKTGEFLRGFMFS